MGTSSRAKGVTGPIVAHHVMHRVTMRAEGRLRNINGAGAVGVSSIMLMDTSTYTGQCRITYVMSTVRERQHLRRALVHRNGEAARQIHRAAGLPFYGRDAPHGACLQHQAGRLEMPHCQHDPLSAYASSSSSSASWRVRRCRGGVRLEPRRGPLGQDPHRRVIGPPGYVTELCHGVPYILAELALYPTGPLRAHPRQPHMSANAGLAQPMVWLQWFKLRATTPAWSRHQCPRIPSCLR